MTIILSWVFSFGHWNRGIHACSLSSNLPRAIYHTGLKIDFIFSCVMNDLANIIPTIFWFREQRSRAYPKLALQNLHLLARWFSSRPAYFTKLLLFFRIERWRISFFCFVSTRLHFYVTLMARHLIAEQRALLLRIDRFIYMYEVRAGR